MYTFVSRLLVLGSLLLGTAFADIITLPPQTSTFSSNVRGYWFTSPVDITITGLFVPTDASTGAQSVEVLLLNVTPPLFSSTTNDFTSVFRVIGDPSTTDYMPANIPVTAGQIVGILGYRGTTNSYGSGNFVTTIGGQDVTLRRFGMQFPLTTTPAQDVWTEAGGSISRIFFSYDLGIDNPVPEPSTYALSLTALGLILGIRRFHS